MIGFYVIMIAVLAMTGAVGYTIFTSVQTTNALSLAERNAARLEMTASALRQVVIADAEGGLFVPMGTPSVIGAPTSRTALPDWISGESVTPWGARYAYCPYAPDPKAGGVAGTVYGGASYAVTVSSEPMIYGASRDYVFSGSRPANGLDSLNAPEVLAFLISPSNNAAAAPSCDSVYWDGRAWLTSGAVTGSVRAVTRDALADSLSQAPRQLRRHVAQGGSGSGLIADEPAGLTQVLSEWRYLRPHRLTVVMQDGGGDIVVSPASLDLGAGPGAGSPDADAFGRHLAFEAAPGDSPFLIGSAAGLIRFPSDLTVDGVSFRPNLGLAAMSGTRILVQNATLSGVDTGGGEIVLGSDVDVISPSMAGAPPVRVTGGALSIEGAVTIDATGWAGPAIDQQGGRVHVDGALIVNAVASPLFEPDSTGEVSASSTASLTLNSAATPLDPYTRTISQSSASEPCAVDDLLCEVTCPDQRAAISGTCLPGATTTNVFLQGTQLSGSVFSCTWAEISETSPDVPAGAGPGAPVASAICAPKR